VKDERRQGDDRRSGTDRRVPTAIWFRLDASFLADGKVIALGEDHGPAGPLVWVALLGTAKAQELATDVDGGVRMDWRALRRVAFLESVDEARAIVATCAREGLIEVDEEDERAFAARVVGWSARQVSRGRPLTSTERSQKHRARQRAAKPTPSDATNGTPAVPARPSAVPNATPGDDATRGDDYKDKDRDNYDSPPSEGVVADAPTIEPSWAEQAVADAMGVFQSIPSSSLAFRGCPADVFAVEQAVVKHPGRDYVAAAREAVVRAAEPSDRPPNLARFLDWALERQGEQPRRNGRRGPAPRGLFTPTEPDAGAAATSDAVYERSARAVQGVEPWEDR
jgi:hypothetical protein